MSTAGLGPFPDPPRWNGLKRSPLKRKSALRRFTRLRPFSAKRRAAEATLAESKVAVLERSEGRCEAPDIPHNCMGAATQFHHMLMRSSGGTHDPENLLHVCTHAHMAIHAYPAEAEMLGYIRRRVSA